jgi:hypothetical protein
MGIHHIGEKFKVVAAKMKKDEKKGFTVEEMMNADKKDQPNGPESSPRKNNNNNNNDNNAPANPDPVSVPAEAPDNTPHNKTEDID